MKVKHSIQQKLLQRLNKPRNKSSYFLVEVLVSFALISIVGFSFFNIQNNQLKQLEESCYQLEADRAFQHAIAVLVEKLYTKQFVWDELEHGTEKKEELHPLAPRFACTYTFTKDQLSHDARKMRISTCIQLQRDDSNKWRRFCEKYNQSHKKTQFEFCVTR
ncbi:MAG TPA: hypothetical protein VN457_00115 [Chlamydiales bacterium]|nr:hypothetical protein [Chlamydiales bacterium]